MQIDELSNTELIRDFAYFSRFALRNELERVAKVIEVNVLTGADLKHWYLRERLIHDILESN